MGDAQSLARFRAARDRILAHLEDPIEQAWLTPATGPTRTRLVKHNRIG